MDYWRQSVLFLNFIACCILGCAFPLSKGFDDLSMENTYYPNFAAVLISVGALLFIAYFVLGCVCCPNKNIKALSYQNGFPVSRLNENAFDNPTEITIFPPQSVIDLQPVNPTFPPFDDKVTFEPLPDILPKNLTSGPSAASSSRPAHFSALLKTKVSLHDWFDDPTSNFPREQLQYLQEIGCGWFGRVVEGEASKICDNEEKTAVVVKILYEEASPSEHLHFLHEVRPYRDLKHPNIIRLLGRCLESDPFLLIMEYSMCDLKSFLLKQDSRETIMIEDRFLQIISNISSGLNYMHEKGYFHTDLAAHNCFVAENQVVKIGDYGISFDRWKGDYYCLGNIALPIRWYSPEILLCSETTIETKEVTKEANVWAFGVVLWEIVNFGSLPYENLSDEEVLQMVLNEKNVQLPLPTHEFPYKNEISLVMRECWKSKKYRPTMDKIESFILQFCTDKLSIKNKELTFEERWKSIHPKITEISSYTGTDSSSLKFENDFSTRSDLQNYSSDNEILSSFDVSFDILPKNELRSQLSPSLNVLNGSIDELTDNDAYLNSTSISYGKYDADTLSNISDKDNFHLEEDKDQFQSNNMFPQQKSAAIRNLDLGLANQPDLPRKLALKCVPGESDMTDKEKEMFLNGVSDMSDVSESFYSKSSNLSEYLDPVVSERYDGMSSTSDLNGNCNFCSNSVSNDELFCLNGTLSKSDKNHRSNDTSQDDNIDNCNNNFKDILCDSNRVINKTSISAVSVVPDIIIHETATNNLAESNEETHSSSYQDTSCHQSPSKVYRFVLKEDMNESAVKLNHQEFSKGLDEELKGSLQNGKMHQPVTSTPVRNNSYSFSPPETSRKEGLINKSNVTHENKPSWESSSYGSQEVTLQADSTGPDQNFLSCQNGSSVNSSALDHFVTAQSSLGCTQSYESENSSVFHDVSDFTMHHSSNLDVFDTGKENSNNSNTLYVTVEEEADTKDNQSYSDVISPPKDYSSSKNAEILAECDKMGNECFNLSRTSDTVSPPRGFQDCGLAACNDSYSESKTSFDQDFSTSAECGSSENLEQFLEDDEDVHSQFAGARLLQTSFPEVASKSFTYENCAEVAGNMRPIKNGSSSSSLRNNSGYDLEFDHEDYQNYNAHDNLKSFRSCDQMIVEDLDTGEQTVINEAYSLCDDYDNSAESDEILKINIETDEAIIVDSSDALIGFRPSRSIELLQDLEIIPPLTPPCEVDEERESSESVNVDACSSASPSPAAIKHLSSPIESSELNYLSQPYRDFNLQNQVIEEEITEEIASPSSFHSSSSYCSNEIFLDDEKMSQSSESMHQGEMYETSVLPSVDHVYITNDGSKSDISSYECSPVKHSRARNSKYCPTDRENNEIFEDEEDVMHSFQPTQSVRWLSDDTLDVDEDGQNPVILEGREILAGDMQKSELTAEDIACALSQFESKDHLHGLPTQFLNVSQSPSPYSSVESSPCREAYTPDFESDSEETGSGASCSSTSGSFECIHNKFKHAVDISKLPDESDKSVSSREQSPLKVFSKSWNCHATPTKGVLVTPEKKLSTMRKSVSFHESDPQVVFEYPPASDSSEEEYLSDDNQEYRRNIDLSNYADWDLQACDAEDVEANDTFEIEELESEPYVRRPSYSSLSVGPLNRPMLYTFTSGFSDEEGDMPDVAPSPSCQAPSNSPDEKEACPVSSSQLSELINSHLNLLVKDNQSIFGQNDGNSSENASSAEPKVSVQEAVGSSGEVEDIVIEKLLPEDQAKADIATVQNGFIKSDSDEEIIVEELEDDPEAASPMKAVSESMLNFYPEVAVGTLSSETNAVSAESADARSKTTSCDLTVSINEASQDLLLSIDNDQVVSLVAEHHGEDELKPESVLITDCLENDGINVGLEKPCSSGEKSDKFLNFDVVESNIYENVTQEQSNSISYACSDLLSDSNLTSISSPVQEILSKSGDSAIKEKVTDLGVSSEGQYSQEDISIVKDPKSCNSNDEKISKVCSKNPGSESDSSSTFNKASEDSNFIQLVGSTCMDENSVQGDYENVFYENTVCPEAVTWIDQGNKAQGINQTTRMEILASNTLVDDTKKIENGNYEVTPSNKAVQKEIFKFSPITNLLNKEGENSDANNCDSNLLSVPKIVVTPASGSESEDDFLEYLKEPTENFTSDSPLQRDFSVTSGFSNQPFEDAFGTYGAEESADYTEAFNFEFENGNFYEDLVDDYPIELQASSMLCPDDGMGKRSSSLPAMTENISDDESLTMKSDSSLVYDMSKGITRL